MDSGGGGAGVVDGDARRGRKASRPDPAEGPVAAFADLLWQLKIEAGDPSFAEMSSQLGAAASKSSLAAAAKGRTLPSWGTTWEFVRVLAVDRMGQDAERAEQQWREHWQRAKLASDPSGENSGLDEPGVPDEEPSDAEPAHPAGLPDTGPRTVPSPASRGERRARRRVPPAVRAAGVVAAAVAGVAAVAGGTAYLTGPAETAPQVQPSLQVDDSRFEGDITYPDGAMVSRGETFEKVWRLRNTGTVPWEGRFLMRANDAVCDAPDRVEIPPTQPGDTVDVRVAVRAPRQPGSCRIYWKMVDLEGRTLFPGKRPIFLDVRIG